MNHLFTEEEMWVGEPSLACAELAIPFNGVVLAHSNEAEWQQFKNNKQNEAFIDRVNIVKVPYCLRQKHNPQAQRALKRCLGAPDLGHI